MRRSIILAMTNNGVIGHQNQLPWHIPEDLRRFRKLTMGHPIIMGRKTYESIGKPLPGRDNIVVTRNRNFAPEGVTIAQTILEAFIVADTTSSNELFVIGGCEVYKQCLANCDRIYLTIIDREYKGDIRFDFALDDWQITHHEYHNNTVPYQFIILDRIKTTMTQWINLERLENNSLPRPTYNHESAGLDFAACLTRPCAIIGSGLKNEFTVTDDGTRHSPPKTPNEGTIPTIVVAPQETILIPLGFKCAVDPGCSLFLYIRSSMSLRGLILANSVAIIDRDYRGELFAAIYNRSKTNQSIKHGDRIVQGIVTQAMQCLVIEKPVDSTTRGTGGFGSTGVSALPTVSEKAKDLQH